MSTSKTWLSLLAAGVVVCAAGTVNAQGIRVRFAPPQLRVETQPAATVEGAVWQPGHWRWTGRSWRWREGRWMQPRGDGYYYSQSRWINQGGQHRYYAGGWRRHRRGPEAHQPRVVVEQQRPEYRHRGRGYRRGGVVIDDRGRHGDRRDDRGDGDGRGRGRGRWRSN